MTGAARLRPWLALLAALALLRLLVAACTPLSPDEAYYRVWSRALAPGFLDHPPMVALWIRFGTALCGDGSLGVRLTGPLSAAAGTLLLAAAAADLGPAAGRVSRAVVAGALLNATLILAAGGVLITPDTPLLLFWTLSLAALARLLAGGRPVWWLPAGAGLGLALDSKYTAALCGLGLAGWLLGTRAGRQWLRTPWPWLAAALALLLFAPVLWWNAVHGWASFLKQGGRTGDWHPSRALGFEGELLGGQVGLATPLVFGLCVLGMARAFCAGLGGDRAGALLCWVTLPPLAVFVQHATGDRVQANWPGLLYPSAVLAAALWAPRFWRPAAALGLLLAVPLYLQAALAPFPLPRALDPTLRMAGWGSLAARTAALGPGFVAADEYGLAAELCWNLPGRVVIAAEPRWRLFALPHGAPAGSGILLRDARRRGGPDPALWTLLGPPRLLRRERSGRVAGTYLAYPVAPRPGLTDLERSELARLPPPGR